MKAGLVCFFCPASITVPGKVSMYMPKEIDTQTFVAVLLVINRNDLSIHRQNDGPWTYSHGPYTLATAYHYCTSLSEK